MAAQIPIKNDPERNRAALAKVREDKLREVQDGHDGTWVAHPGLIPVAMEVFDQYMPSQNQIANKRTDVKVTEDDLLETPTGTRTEGGLRQNLSVGVRYLAAWLAGNGCVPIQHLMEDAATAEISRTQVWQWVRHCAVLEDGRTVSVSLVETLMAEERATYPEASALFLQLVTSRTLPEFLTLPAYAVLTEAR
jgi:malate synthase